MVATFPKVVLPVHHQTKISYVWFVGSVLMGRVCWVRSKVWGLVGGFCIIWFAGMGVLGRACGAVSHGQAHWDRFSWSDFQF